MSAPVTEPQQYVVVETLLGGATYVWGPFSEHRALMAADALRERASVQRCDVHALYSSRDLDNELPDWKRSARV